MNKHSYTLCDSGNFEKLEQLGPYRIVRPAAQAVWEPRLSTKEWQSIDAKFTRTTKGEGSWQILNKKLPPSWPLSLGPLSMEIRLTDFGHIGMFPEHHAGNALEQGIKACTRPDRPCRVLNLFAYTGALTLLAAHWGATVVHLDASRKSVAWARDNALLNHLDSKPIRWLVDDVKKFVAKEIRRGAEYDAIVLDPPSFGRGNKGERWQIEEDLLPLLHDLIKLRSKDFAFLLLSSHTPGYTPLVLANILSGFFPREELHAYELSVEEQPSQRPLPSGAACHFLTAGEHR